MATTFGGMTERILAETYRDPSFTTQVQNAIVSAIKELETEQLFINQKYVQLTLNPGTESTLLPNDFISVLTMTLSYPNGNSVFSQANGFKETTFYELVTFRDTQIYQYGIPGYWALYNDFLHVWPMPAQSSDGFTVNMWYYFRDGYYPSQPNDYSIWFGDFTEDVTRYTARGIFYRDSLQSPELAASDMQKAQDALARLKIRNSQRENLNNLSY